mgnify:CR=1 FL=1
MSLLPYAVARPFLFGLDPEAAHELTLDNIARFQHSPLSCLWGEQRVDDPVRLNPFFKVSETTGFQFVKRWR